MSAGAAFRLASGGLIDRSTSLSFTFDGTAYSGHPGDTLASALVANGVKLVGRSFKYHRPRGLLAAGAEEPNALVELREGARREPNTRATAVDLYDGLVAASQNRWPSLAVDVMAVNQIAGPILAAGFYYKTFMWPASFWEKVYEPLIRRAAGLGRSSGQPDPDRYEKVTLHCDVLVIGAGPAGLAAALAAARAGARVVVADEDARPGGRLLAERAEIDGAPARDWAASAAAELASLPDVTLLPRTTVFGVYDHGTYGAVQRLDHSGPLLPADAARERLWRIVARRAVLAAGAIERPLVFADNDRPGIMLAGAVRAYVNRWAAAPGRRIVVLSDNDEAARTVSDLAAAGIAVAALVDTRAEVPQRIKAAAEAAGARVYAGGAVKRVLGGHAVRGLEIVTPLFSTTLDCDAIAMSGGWSPAVHLTSHLGGKPAWSEEAGAFVPGTLPPGMAVAGAAAGRMRLDECLTSGAWAGLAAVEDLGFTAPAFDVPQGAREADGTPSCWPDVKPGGKGKAFVDFQNDVTLDDVALAEREAFRSVEHLKRYTTLGMATDQGKTSNLNGLAAMAALRGTRIGEVGTTTFRPPYTPVSLGALAGHHKGRQFRPTRLTAAHGWAAENGASFVETGAWLRAQWFSRPGEDWLASCTREVKAVREGVGLCDVSTLGKIDIQGPDAAVLLDRLYTGTFSTLAVGRARYGLMLREDGFVFDDGTTSRLGPEHFLMTTTTANAGAVMQHIEFCHQWLWPELDVQYVSVTEQWAQFAVAGPRSRTLLQRVVDREHDLSDAAFPFMAAGAVTAMGGIAARLFRISFSGELAYEIGVPARYGDALARALMEAGADLGVTPYGLEALNVLRIEKGHVAGGELNGQTTAADLGLGRMVSTKKDFIGRVMAKRPALVDPDRPRLVGFRTLDPTEKVGGGAHFLDVHAKASAEHDLGHVTSVCWSPLFGRWIGLGLIKGGAERAGEVVRAWDGVRERDVRVELCDPCFYDAQGVRLRG